MKQIITVEGRTFECYISAELGGKICGVSICEVKRPNWRIFRSIFQDQCTFWVDDYESIQEGVRQMIIYFLAREQEARARYEKWCALEKNGKTQKEKIK